MRVWKVKSGHAELKNLEIRVSEGKMKKILFIGNSHTYMNDMPELARRMIEDATGEECQVVMLAYSGRSLKWHMDEEYFSERFNILNGHYDYCIIQECAHPMTEFEDTIKYTHEIIELCKKVNTTPIIFETWAEKDKPENQLEMNRRYRKIAEDEGVKLAPIGEIWSKVLKELVNEPDADLYYKDGAHASSIGDYLVAMTLTKTITGKLPDVSFREAFDFTLPDDAWNHVKLSVEDEGITIPENIASIIRDNIEKAFA